MIRVGVYVSFNVACLSIGRVKTPNAEADCVYVVQRRLPQLGGLKLTKSTRII